MNQIKSVANRFCKKWTTKDGLIGDYDYSYLFLPEIPFMTREPKTQPFFGLNTPMPIILGAILGFQHALAMLAGIVTPPIIISATANFTPDLQSYLVSSSLIVSGILSVIQITRFKLFKGYYIGTGLLTVVGTSFATITIVTNAIPAMYKSGECPSAPDGSPLPCPDGYGRILASGIVCSLLEMLLSFLPPKLLQKIFPPIVTGPVVLLIGTSLVGSGFKDWVGGADCEGAMCTIGSHIKPWGSAEFIGLGFLVYITIILSERFGSPIMKSCAVIVGLLVGCIVAAACGYFSSENVKAAKAVTFMWVHTFKLQVYGPVILPFLAVYIVLMMEAIGDITATCDVSRLEVEGTVYETRIQGGVLADGVNGLLAGLATITPVSTFAQNNGVISITKCANRKVGYWCSFFLLIMGIFSKFAGAIVSIPKPVLGGVTTFLFTAVVVSGLKIIASTELSRRDRIVLTASILPGLGATLVPGWFDNVFTYDGDNSSLKSFFTAIMLVMETGFAVTGIFGVLLNLLIPETSDEVEEINELVLEVVGSADQSARAQFARKEAMKLDTLQAHEYDKGEGITVSEGSSN